MGSAGKECVKDVLLSLLLAHTCFTAKKDIIVSQ